MNSELLHHQLKDDRAALKQALDHLLYSHKKCGPILQKSDHYSIEELESLEAFTARFARTADLFTQKVLKGLFMMIKERPQTFIDKANLLEKLEVIEHADTLIAIRELRNQIAHEYSSPELSKIFKAVFEKAPSLKEMIETVEAYLDRLQK